MARQLDAAELAAMIVIPGGSGTDDDVAAVRPQIARLPAAMLSFFVEQGARVVACRGSVTDVETELKGKVPRGWEDLDPKRFWDDVPGTYLDAGRKVIVATRAAPGGGRKVPDKGDGHGSANLALHETLHGRHRLENDLLQAARFLQARRADFPRLPDYLRQADIAGLEETFAESGARFFAGDPTMAADWPALTAFWSGAPIPAGGEFGATDVLASVDEGAAGEEIEGPPAIGSAEMEDDGTIILDLRAASGGAVGHALFTVRPDDPDYQRVLAQHFPDQGATEILAGFGGGARRSVLIRAAGKE